MLQRICTAGGFRGSPGRAVRENPSGNEGQDHHIFGHDEQLRVTAVEGEADAGQVYGGGGEVDLTSSRQFPCPDLLPARSCQCQLPKS